MMTKGLGVMPAAMTFWNADDSYNEKETQKYVKWIIDQGAHSLSVTGSTGDNISMTIEETKAIMKSMFEAVEGRVPVYPGTGRYNTEQTIELSQYAQKLGAAGVLVIMPYYLIPHKRAVMDHFRELRKAIDIDIILYDNPTFCNYELLPRELVPLVEEGVINGVKLANGKAARCHELKHYCGDKVTAFYGHDFEPAEAFLGGADGWLSGLPAIFPKFSRTLFDICTVEHDPVKAMKYWDGMQDYVDYFITYNQGNDPHWHEVFKYTLKCFGFDAGLPRRPLRDLQPEEKKTIDKILADMPKDVIGDFVK